MHQRGRFDGESGHVSGVTADHDYRSRSVVQGHDQNHPPIARGYDARYPGDAEIRPNILADLYISAYYWPLSGSIGRYQTEVLFGACKVG